MLHITPGRISQQSDIATVGSSSAREFFTTRVDELSRRNSSSISATRSLQLPVQPRPCIPDSSKSSSFPFLSFGSLSCSSACVFARTFWCASNRWSAVRMLTSCQRALTSSRCCVLISLDVEENASAVFEHSRDFEVRTNRFDVAADGRDRRAIASFDFRHRWLRHC